MPLLERPREKALRFGIATLSNEEILALLLGSGGYQNSAIEIARNMLIDSRGLYQLGSKDIKQFEKYKGISTAKALTLSAVFEIAKRYHEKEFETMEEDVFIDGEYLSNKYNLRLIDNPRETFILVILSKKRQIVHEITLFRGNNNRMNISYREIFHQILLNSGYYIYVIHNHPSGSFKPSKEDVVFTSSLSERCEKVGVVLLDHLIISDEGYYSFYKDQPGKISK